MNESSVNTERSTVKTYIPAYQKAEWKEHAEDLDMSLSEFVRTMVQAGRRGFVPDGESIDESMDQSQTARQSEEISTENGDQSLDEEVLRILAKREPLTWDELIAAITDDVESRLEGALNSLQAENRIQHSGRVGGYVLANDEY